jgi:hypothetical protein
LEGATETPLTVAAMARLINIRLYKMLSSRLLVLGAIENDSSRSQAQEIFGDPEMIEAQC